MAINEYSWASIISSARSSLTVRRNAPFNRLNAWTGCLRSWLAAARNALRSKLFNRVIARMEGEIDLEGVKDAVAAATGAEVVKVRRGAIGMLSFQFRETDPPRDKAAQDLLVEKLQAMGTFKSVEGEKVFTAK